MRPLPRVPKRGPHSSLLMLVVLAMGAIWVSACGPEYPSCEKDEHCVSHNQVCVDKMCRDCRDDSQCNAVDPCMTCSNTSVCERRQSCCQSDLDCPDGRCWKSGNAPGTCGGECQSNDHCPEGQRCAGQSCVPDRSCTDDAGCSEGERCVQGQCTNAACDIQTVRFDFNEYTIRLDQEETLAANATCIKERMQPFRVEGHCDERGSDEYNLALGQRRAGAVARQYKTLGISKDLLNTISFGEERSACSASSEQCWQENRRVDTVAQ